jgi:hypothetical protein
LRDLAAELNRLRSVLVSVTRPPPNVDEEAHLRSIRVGVLLSDDLDDIRKEVMVLIIEVLILIKPAPEVKGKKKKKRAKAVV